MTEKNYAVDFRRMRFLTNRLPMARFRLLKARSQATRITPVLSDMPHGTDVSSPVERGFMIIEAAQDAVYIVETELQSMRETLGRYMDVLTDPLEITAVQMRYMDGRSAREIAYSLNYSERHIFRVLECAERKINRAAAAKRCH